MSDNLELDCVTEKRSAPAKAWKNRWLVMTTGRYRCSECHTAFLQDAGEEYTDHCERYPSEQAARSAGADWAAHFSVGLFQRYLGPVPVPTT